MKQVLQNLRSGQTEVAELPAPGLGRGQLLIQTRASLISAGTERMLVEFGKASLLAKARSQPDKVRQVLDKIRSDGLLPTLEAVFNRLDEPLPLGYCNAGVVLAVGRGVGDFAPGDRVVSNGPHAELVAVPKNLCAKIPEGVSDEQAAFTVLSAIGLQGIRLAGPSLGETFVVFGLGLIGLVTVQLLRASGCSVLGVDINPRRLVLAEKFGARTINAAAGGDIVAAAAVATAGRGADGVIITASAKTDELVHQAAQCCRKRGRIVLVGVVGLNLRRADFYEKELSFQVSCSYGPGRYDEAYEQGGQDYPAGFVRWTEGRNFQAVLDALANRQLAVDDLITHRYELSEAAQAYQTVASDSAALGVILKYPTQVEVKSALSLSTGAAVQTSEAGQDRPVVGVIGAGNFSKMTLMPALAKTSARIAYVADLNPAAAKHLGKKFGAQQVVSDYQLMLKDPSVQAVLIAVGHNLHARMICEVLAAGKHAFVEKPLAMNVSEVEQILSAVKANPAGTVTVGFNRRFSPHIQRVKRLLASRSEPLAMTFTANAGAIPPGHWVHDPVRGGGRIIGEACHYIDLMVYLSGSGVRTVSAVRMGEGPAVRDDKMAIVLGFADGSVGTVNYFANGSRSFPKEMMEIFSQGRVLRLENFRRLQGWGFEGFKKLRTWRQDKGHAAEFAAYVEGLRTGLPALIPLDELVNVTLASLAAQTAAHEQRTVHLLGEYSAILTPPGEAR